MKNPRNRSQDDEDQAFQEWAGWCKSFLDAQGWGGGAERDVLQNLVFGRTSGGGASNPVLAELIATEADGQDLCQRVHRHLQRYAKEKNRYWFAIPWLRYVGAPVPKSKMKMTGYDSIQIGAASDKDETLSAEYKPILQTISVTIEIPRLYAWSGLQTWEAVAEQSKMSVRNCQVIMNNVKVELGLDLRMDRHVMRGRHLHDGPASEKEARAKQEQIDKREQRRNDMEPFAHERCG